MHISCDKLVVRVQDEYKYNVSLNVSTKTRCLMKEGGREGGVRGQETARGQL